MTKCDEGKEQLIEQIGFSQYFQAKRWADYNRKFFNQLAPKYDYLNEVITLGMQTRYKTQVIKRSPIKNGDYILDICTGSGDMALLMAKLFPKSRVVGVDVAEKMLEIAKVKSKGLPNVHFEFGDAMQLPYPDNSFNVTMMSYGLRNLTDFKVGIAEMRRVTKPNGVIIIVDLGKPSGFLNKIIYKFYFETLMPFLGHYVFHRGEFNSFKYLPESNKFFPSAQVLKNALINGGLKNVRTYTYMMGIVSQQVCFV